MASREELLEAALAYAAQGIKVFPVLSGRKEPATAHGVKDASTDPDQIKAWWRTTPYLIGVATGPESGVFVIDVDPRNGGSWTSPVRTATVQTGGRYEGVPPGTHYWFKWPVGVSKMRRTLAEGLDVQGRDKYVIAPPSVTQEAYVWTDLTWPPADCPPEILAEIAIPEGTTTDTRPGDRFNATHTWAEILEGVGWSVDHEGPDGETFWTRPGKTEGISATTNYQGSDLFYVFSTSTEFETERGYDKFGVYSILYHDGDVAKAASELAGSLARPSLLGAGTPSAPASSLVVPTPPQAATPATARPGAPYSFEPATHADHLVSHFITYCEMVCDAPAEYAEAGALSLLAACTSGMKIALGHLPRGLQTNLYLCLIGASSVSRKSTIQENVKTLLNMLRPNSILPDRFASTESAIGQLGQRSTAVWLPDEFGSTLQQIYTNDTRRGLEELMLTLYSGQTFRYVTLARGEETIDGIDLNIFGATTPSSLGKFGKQAIGSGLLPRFGLVYPSSRPQMRPPVPRQAVHDEWLNALHARFRAVLDLCSYPGAPREITVSREALAILSSVDAEFGSAPITARLVTMAYKVAGLLALGDLRYEVSEADAAAAVAITRRWSAGARNLRRYLNRPSADVEFMEQVDAVREELRAMCSNRMPLNGRWVLAKRDVARQLDLPATTFKRIQDTLENRGDIIVAQTEDGEVVWHVG